MLWLQRAAEAERRSVSNFVRVAIEEHLERNYAELKPTDREVDEARMSPLRRSLAQT